MFKIGRFSAQHQASAANLINTNLGRRFGFIDETKNPDLFDIESAYADGFFFVALKEREVVGTGGITAIRGESAQIVRMHTHPDYRRRGVARAMLQYLEHVALAHSIRTLRLETNLDWEDAIAFYKTHDFQEVVRSQHGIQFEKRL